MTEITVTVRCGGSLGRGRVCGRELGAIEDDPRNPHPRLWDDDGRIWFSCPSNHGRGYVDIEMFKDAATRKTGTVLATR